MDVSRTRRRFDLCLAGIFPGIQQVDPDRVVEQVGFLGDHADLGGQGSQRNIPQVLTVDQNATAGRVV